MQKHTLMRQLVAQRQANFSLPQPFYTDQDLFELDMENLFHKHWLFAGHDCEIANEGDYFTLEIGAQPVIIVRGKDGAINAFHNSCKHRGSRICAEKSGTGPKLVCPYHQWTYDLDGQLQFAKDMGPDFNPADYKLKSTHCRSVAGCIYICLAEHAPDFSEFSQSVKPYLLPHNLQDAKVAHQSTIVEEGNWKLVIENNRECYHCQGSHPELCRTYSDDPALTGVALEGGSPEIEAHWQKCEDQGIASRFYMPDSGQFRVSRIPLLRDTESFTMDGAVASSKTMVQSDDQALGSLLLFHYPNTWNHFLSDHAITFQVIPISATRTIVTTKWLVHKDAVAGVDYDLEQLTTVWQATNEQDRQLVEENQIGINSPGYTPGPYSPLHEDGVAQFVDWYCQATTAALDERLSGVQAEPITLPPIGIEQTASNGTVAATAAQIPLVAMAPVTTATAATVPAATKAASLAQLSNPMSQSESKQFSYLDRSAPWQDQSQLLQVVSLVPEVEDVITVTFRTENNAYFNFAPGQFVTLELPVNGENLYRTYTISSSPSRPYSLSVTVKAQRGSIGTRWMLDHLRPGMKIRAFGPSGQFHLYHHPAEKYCFISAGSGITPMASMTNFLYDQGGDIDVSFIHCARRPSEIIFKRSLEQMAARVPGISLAWIVEGKDQFAAWAGYVGRFNQLILELSTPDFFEREVFCCGPEPFMQAVRDVLIAADFNMQQYHEESFAAPNFADEDIQHDDVQLDEAIATNVHFLVSGHHVESTQNITVLESANQAGLNIPSACNFGVCGTCKVKKVSGDTHMVHNGGISDADIEAGYILACCSKPINDLVISY